MVEIIDKIIEGDHKTIIGMTIEETTIENKDVEIEVRDLLYEYKDTFSSRDEITTCPYIEVEIDVTDKTPFFIRPYHAKEEERNILDKEMKRLCYFGILKEGFFCLFQPSNVDK